MIVCSPGRLSFDLEFISLCFMQLVPVPFYFYSTFPIGCFWIGSRSVDSNEAFERDRICSIPSYC